MVDTIKRWLGIDVLAQENLRLAVALKVQSQRIAILEAEKKVTPEQPKAKILSDPTPRRVNWRQARAALEAASEPQEEL